VKRLWLIFWRMGFAYLFYPAMIGLFIWIDYKNFHWIFGLMVILAIFILDPIWARIAKNAVHKFKNPG